MRKEGYNWIYSWNYTGDWYLLRAKFMNDWNFFVCWLRPKTRYDTIW